MTSILRTAFAFAGIVAITIVAIVWAEVGTELVAMGKSGGDFDGPFSSIVSQIDTLFPLIIAFLVVCVFIFWLVGSVREERAVERRRVR